MQDELIQLLEGRSGHFQMESGYHSEQWFELNRLLAQTDRLRPFVFELGRRLASENIDAVCGPMSGGAQLAKMIAAELSVPALHAERIEPAQARGLFPVQYRLPQNQHSLVRDRRVAIVDDA